MGQWITLAWNTITRAWQRVLIVAVCLGVAFARMIFPDLKVDGITVWLIAIAAAIILMPKVGVVVPYFLKAIPYIKKASIAGIEFELTDDIKKLAKDLDIAQQSAALKPRIGLSGDLLKQVADIVDEAKIDPRAALLLLAAKMEQQIVRRMEDAGISERKRYMPLPEAVALGVRDGLYPPEILPAFREFWAMRNKVAHGQAFEVDRSLILSLVSIGTELLKIISTETPNGPSNPQ